MKTRSGSGRTRLLTLSIVSVVFSWTSASPGAWAQAADPAEKPSTSASGRGVRIIAAEPPSPAPIAHPPQVTPASAQAVEPARTAVTGGTAPTRTPAATPSVLKPCDRPVAKPALRFGDPAGFDRMLRTKLRGSRAVVVDMDTPYPAAKEAPAPLGAWLNEVAQSGGSVSVSPYCQKGRGFGGFFAKLFGGGPAEPYKAARKYDAVLHVDALDQVVTQVEFTPRKSKK